jgi:hypothetical protein
MRLTKRTYALSERGIAHLLLPLFIVAIIAVIGGYIFLKDSPAATVTYEFKSGMSRKCLDVWHDGSKVGATVDLYTCNGTAAQQWNINANGTIEDANGQCLDNWKALNANYNPIRTYTCSSTDGAQQWRLTGNLLKNPMTGKCIDDPGFSMTNGKPLELYTCNGGKNQTWLPTKLAAVSSPTSAPTPTPIPTPTPTGGGGSNMILGVNMNGITGSSATDMAGAVKYVRVDMSWGGTAPTYTKAGMKVDDLLQGSYSTSGIAGLGNATTWADKQLSLYKSDGCTPTLCPMIEVLNEPGGTWFWGNNALSESNASAYDNIIIATYNAFKTTYGSSSPLLLASFDGGMSDGSGGWGQDMWQANKNIGNYINGITVHPYDTSSTGLGSQSNVTNSYAKAKSLAGHAIPVYITEVGWQTALSSTDDKGDTPQSGGVLLTPAQQCSNVYNYVSWARGLGYVNAVMFFDYRDDTSSMGDGTYGIEYGNGVHKPSYNALVDAAAGKANPC